MKDGYPLMDKDLGRSVSTEQFDPHAHVNKTWRDNGREALQFSVLVEMVQAAYSLGQRQGREEAAQLVNDARFVETDLRGLRDAIRALSTEAQPKGKQR